MATVDESLSLVDGLAKLMTAHHIDAIQVGNVKLSKSFHEFPLAPKPISPASQDDDDELLFHSSTP